MTNFNTYHVFLFNKLFTMNVKILFFGITKDIVGDSTLEMVISDGDNVGEMMKELRIRFPRLEDLNSLLVAVNSEYAKEDMILNNSDEIALIPPVSGG